MKIFLITLNIIIYDEPNNIGIYIHIASFRQHKNLPTASYYGHVKEKADFMKLIVDI